MKSFSALLKGITSKHDYGKKWHYLAVKSLSALLKEITSKYDEDF